MKLIHSAGALSLSALILSGCDVLNDIPQGLGYLAKNNCSAVFVAGQDLKETKDLFVSPEVAPYDILTITDVDVAAGTVSSRDILFGQKNLHVAMHRPGFGCVLQYEATAAELDAQTPEFLYSDTLPSDQVWPAGSAGMAPRTDIAVDYDAIDTAIDNGYEPLDEKVTTSIAVVYKGQLIAERYRPTYGPFTPILGWSLTKGVTSTLVGILSDDGLLDVNDRANIDEWIGTDKESITLNNLLQMAHGLQYEETSRGENADQGRMVFDSPSQADYMIARPLAEVPGTVYNYATGSTALVAYLAQNAMGGALGDAYEFYQTELFQKLGITTSVFEHDTTGYFLGGSALNMSARDWARFGQLYLQNGEWNGERILSQDWMNYALAPSSAQPTFGASVWLNTNQERWPTLPADAFGFNGHQEQMIMIVPSKDLVVVRTGFTYGGEEIGGQIELVAEILLALP